MIKSRLASIVPAFLLVAAGCGSPVSTQSGAAACIVASACGLIPGSASACTQTIASVNDPSLGLLVTVESGIDVTTKITPAQVNCIANAGMNCTQAKNCLANGATPAACTGTSSTCMGTILASCGPEAGSNGNNGQSLYDCSTLGAGYTCVASNGNVSCGTASCGGGNPTMCSGNIAQRCANGIFVQVDCTQFSATCVTAGLEAHCRGAGAACTQTASTNNPDATIRCDGSVLVTCSDGQEARYDCGRENLGCYANPSNGVFGCYAGNQCDPGSFTSTCAGNVLTFCNKGKIDTFNCGGSGFTGCDANNGTCTHG